MLTKKVELYDVPDQVFDLGAAPADPAPCLFGSVLPKRAILGCGVAWLSHRLVRPSNWTQACCVFIGMATDLLDT